MRRRSPITFLMIPLFLAIVEIAAYVGWNHMLKDIGFSHHMGLFRLFYFSEITFTAVTLLFVMGSFGSRLNIRRTYYGFQGAGIIMADLLPKLIFTLFVIVYGLIQGAYIGINNLFIHSAHLRLNMDWFLFLGSALSITLFILIVRGILVGRFDFKVEKETIYYDNLPEAFDGLKIVQFSDMHIGSFYRHKEQITKAVEMMNNLKPDIIFFTGDMVNNIAEEFEGYENVFNKLHAPLGIYSILGNHDYGDYMRWKNIEEKRHNLETLIMLERKAGFDLLLNSNRLISRDGQQIAIIGVENWGTPPFAQYGNLADSIKGTEQIPFRILLSHDPSHWDEEVKEKTSINLTLSGHTHGMQFGIRIGKKQYSPVQLRYEKWSGLYSHTPNQHMYVNRGLGHLGFPGRVGMLPEITLMELRRK